MTNTKQHSKLKITTCFNFYTERTIAFIIYTSALQVFIIKVIGLIPIENTKFLTYVFCTNYSELFQMNKPDCYGRAELLFNITLLLVTHC